MRVLVLTLAFALLAPFAGAASPVVNSPSYQEDYAKWRKELEASRRTNWLTLVGLFWLRDGENRVGGDQKNEVPLTADKAPAQVGTIRFHDGKAMFHAV